jgi:putative (di)nucleoside polyphosphate hydrolase
MTIRDDKLYRLGVGVMMLNQQNKVFVGQRRDFDADAWQMPQGGIDANETPAEALRRELNAELDEWLYYDLPSYCLPKFWQGRYIGQKQKWFLAQFQGSDDEINIHTKEPEFKEWRWADRDTLVDSIVAFKKEMYIKVVKAFEARIIQRGQ